MLLYRVILNCLIFNGKGYVKKWIFGLLIEKFVENFIYLVNVF